ncbi:MAG: hypothetical protein EOP04_11520 [Proteobacteria bacterium]|nr:MAG: hypothetical protein EOP04_11520 [Pseudomonadota bacterium]
MLTKMILLLTIFTTGMISAQPKVDRPQNFVEIPVDSDRAYNKKNSRDDEEIRVLKARVRILEAATRELQQEIYSIKYGHGSSAHYPNLKPTAWYCSVKSSFSKSYSGRGATQLDAKDTALNTCQKEDSIHCRVDNVDCEKEV